MARKQAILVLEDGRTFTGEAYGAIGETFGEAVFTTGMTGYQETLTDPSYHRQVVVQTAPQIGNTGVNAEDDESDRIWVAGYVVRDPARRPSNWRSTGDLGQRLADEGVVGISGIDTRALTRHLRERGAMRVGVSSTETDPEALLQRVRQSSVPRRRTPSRRRGNTVTRSPPSTWASNATCLGDLPHAASPPTCSPRRPAWTRSWPCARMRCSSRRVPATRPPRITRWRWPPR
jgi:carbamoyl-phosphate synthase small subunit